MSITSWEDCQKSRPTILFADPSASGGTRQATPSTGLHKQLSSSFKSLSEKSLFTTESKKGAFNQVSGELGKNLVFLNDYKPIEEVESDLYDLTKDYKRYMGSPKIRLDSIQHFHHLMQLQDSFADLSESGRRTLQRDSEAVLKRYPWAMNEYRWYSKFIGLINILAVKWELVNAHRYAYRNFDLSPSNSAEANKHARQQTMVFTIDTVWLAVTCNSPPLCYQFDESAQAYSGYLIGRLIQLVRYLLSLNYNADFFMHPSIKGFTGFNNIELEVIKIRKKRKEKTMDKQRGFSISGAHELRLPQYAGLISSEHIERAKRGLKPSVSKKARKARRKIAESIGFHLLELPANFCKCMNSKFDDVNLKLRDLLCDFEEAYRLFEYSAKQDGNVIHMPTPEEEEPEAVESPKEYEEELCTSRSH
jgi:hypothetical protein